MNASTDPSPLGTPRIPSSRHARPSSSNSPLRPSSARSLVKGRPATPGSPSINTDVKVESRPLTQQGMISMRSSFQGPGRQILDRSYYVGKLRSKKKELQQEIERMVEEVEQLEKERFASVHVGQKQKALAEEVQGLKLQLLDYTAVMEKVNAGVEPDELREELEALKERNAKETKKADKLFLERTLKEREGKELHDKAQGLDVEIEHKIAEEAPEAKVQYVELQQEYRKLETEVERLQSLIGEIGTSNEELEQNVFKSNPTKQKLVMLTDQLLTVEGELEKLRMENPSIKLTAEEAKEALLSKIRQDNLEIIKAEEKSQVLENEIHFHEGKIAEAERSISELKGGRIEKFLEMQQKERKMQNYIENFDSLREEQQKRTFEAQQKICELLHLISQLDDFEAKTETDISCTKQAISLLENEMEDFKRLDGSRSQCDAKCAKLEAEKQKIEEKKAFLQEQVREQVEKLEAFSQILDDSDLHRNLEELKTRFHALQSSNQVLQEEVETKERELNYGLVLENIRFMVSQLNSEIRNSQMQSY
ncbi:intraflagellar transport protein 74 homolog [Selaginella moellendorffii]|uniref:intraflagellar transport protein 74 homolog n=1 Tax=Selaginella moellendorffii TaxID=88036 RepID=UPI000D1C9F45|nr:intraflagellar transport protein 74 homolog [Selaginella moellendorffii]|eukprot:XP_024533191.1 intraflagellar transport protein 74 homolog [Selaginella moellendorffii]